MSETPVSTLEQEKAQRAADQEFERKAALNNYAYRPLPRPQPCEQCHRSITIGYVMFPGMNYPLCGVCARLEFDPPAGSVKPSQDHYA